MKSPITWLGGKGVLMPKLLPFLEMVPHTHYCSVFGGGASDLFAKKPVSLETYNDLDKDLVGFFTTLQSHKFYDLYKYLCFMPYSRHERNYALKNKASTFTVEGAAQFYCRVRQGFAGLVDKTSWGFVKNSTGKQATTTAAWWSSIQRLPEIHKRLSDVTITNENWFECLQRQNDPTTLVYLDPPYCPETRRDGQYRHEMSRADHQDLVKQILDLKCAVVLSGYANEVYVELEEAGWQRHDFDVACMVVARTAQNQLLGTGAVSKKQKRTESIWLNRKANR